MVSASTHGTNIVTVEPPCMSVRPPPFIEDRKVLTEEYAEFLHDESKSVGGPIASLCFPTSTEELSAALVELRRRSLPVRVSGGRTGVTGASTPGEEEAVISLRKMARIGSDEQRPMVSSENREIRVEAGVSLHELTEQLKAEGIRYTVPVDPTESWASIGGIVANNASGARSFLYGSIRQWVSGLVVVLMDGSVLRLRRGQYRAVGGKFIFVGSGASEVDARALQACPITKPPTKNTVGYSYDESVDLIDLFIGSEGTLAIISEVVLTLSPEPEVRLLYLQAFENDLSALAFVRMLRDDSNLRIESLELCDEGAVRFASAPPSVLPPMVSKAVGVGAAVVYVELPLDDESELEAVYERILNHVIAAGANPDRSVSGVDDRIVQEVRAFRHAVPERINATIAARKREIPSLHKVSTDMAVPDEHLEHIFRFYRERLDSAGLEYVIFGHAGNNHLHVNILPRSVDELERGKDIYTEFAREVVRLGGAVSAEHGLGRLKRHLLEIQYPKEVLDEMRKIRAFFDAEGRLNRGVLFE